MIGDMDLKYLILTESLLKPVNYLVGTTGLTEKSLSNPHSDSPATLANTLNYMGSKHVYFGTGHISVILLCNLLQCRKIAIE